jgi:hypothetical protein
MAPEAVIAICSRGAEVVRKGTPSVAAEPNDRLDA